MCTVHTYYDSHNLLQRREGFVWSGQSNDSDCVGSYWAFVWFFCHIPTVFRFMHSTTNADNKYLAENFQQCATSTTKATTQRQHFILMHAEWKIIKYMHGIRHWLSWNWFIKAIYLPSFYSHNVHENRWKTGRKWNEHRYLHTHLSEQQQHTHTCKLINKYKAHTCARSEIEIGVKIIVIILHIHTCTAQHSTTCHMKIHLPFKWLVYNVRKIHLECAENKLFLICGAFVSAG